MMKTSVKYDDDEENKVSAKSLTFYSHAGKTRLSRIWIDRNLSQEILFSSWSLGQSEALLKVKVTDYMYTFLQSRFRR